MIILRSLIDDPRMNERNVDQFIIKKRRKFNVIITHNKNLTQVNNNKFNTNDMN